MATAKEEKFKKELKKNIDKVVDNFAKEVFQEAQKMAPSNTGALKQAGYWVSSSSGGLWQHGKDTGFSIIYKAPYAYKLHEGGKPGELLGNANPADFPWKADTRRHKRKLPGKTVWVRRHTKTYKKIYKPTKVAEEWKAINYENTRDTSPNKWIQKAYSKVYKKHGKLLQSMFPKEMTIRNATAP